MRVDLDRSSIRFPSTGHIWIPRHGRRAAAAGLSLHSPCKPLSVLAQRMIYVAVRAVGSGVIPGTRADWPTPVDESSWGELLAQWRSHVGSFDAVALYLRPQAGRVGFSALLLDRGRGVAFSRVHPDPDRVEKEFHVLEALTAARPTTFRVARPLALGQTASSSWMLTSSVPNYPLGAVRKSSTRRVVAHEIGEMLSSALPRPAGVPAQWTAAHGDFSPWNLRTSLSGEVHVIDWEDAGFAPPGVDLLYGDLTAQATFGGPLPQTAPHEARTWLIDMLDERARERGSLSVEDERLRTALVNMRAIEAPPR